MDGAAVTVGRRVLAVGVALLVVVGGGWWVSSLGDEDDRRGPTAAGEAVIEEFVPADREQQQAVTAPLLTGATYDSKALLGQVLVYNVWGSWCAPCVAEAPELVEVAADLAGQVSFIGLNVRDNDAAARAFEAAQGVPYPSVPTSDSGRVMLSFGSALSAAAVPSTLVVDRQGRVAARAIGQVSAATLRALIRPVLAER